MSNIVKKLTIVLILALVAGASGCVTESKPADKQLTVKNADGVPPQVLRVPQQLQDLSGLLLRYHAKRKVLPTTLMALMDEQLISADEYVALPDYAYHPNGLGRLGAGRVVILVDTEVHIEDHVWCIVREPDSQRHTIQFNVMPVSLDELEAAASSTSSSRS